MPFDVSSHPIYESILRAISTDPDTGEYSPMAANMPYLIRHVPEDYRNNGVGINAALKTLENERFIKKFTEDFASYYDLATKGREHIKEKLDK